MKPFTLTLSHPYKEMRERTSRQAEGKTTLLGVGWFFPHCHGRDTQTLPMTAAMTVAVAATAVRVTISRSGPVVGTIGCVTVDRSIHHRGAISRLRRVVNHRRRTYRGRSHHHRRGGINRQAD